MARSSSIDTLVKRRFLSKHLFVRIHVEVKREFLYFECNRQVLDTAAGGSFHVQVSGQSNFGTNELPGFYGDGGDSATVFKP